jgi:hypothetical protein
MLTLYPAKDVMKSGAEFVRFCEVAVAGLMSASDRRVQQCLI